MKKLNKKQKEHIKNVFVKTINIFCYVCTGILALFLLITCLQSCRTKSPKGLSAESDYLKREYTYGLSYDDKEFSYIYSLRFPQDTAYSVPLTAQNELLSPYGIDVYEQYDSSRATRYFTLADIDGYVLVDESLYSITRINFACSTYLTTDAYSVYYYSYQLASIALYSPDLGYSFNVVRKYDDSNTPTFFSSSYAKLLVDEELLDYPLFNYFYEVSEPTYFTFNKRFNYNAPFGVNLDVAYNPVPPSDMPVNQIYMDYNVGWFISNGELYDSIRWNIRNNSGQEFWLWIAGNVNSVISSHDAVGFTWVSLEYRNSSNNKVTTVCYRNTDVASYQGAYVTFYNTGCTWSLDSYREITFLQNLSPSVKASIEQFNNNNQNSITGNVVSGDVNNIFTLISSAFSAWLPILSIYLLPGITLGTLVFIPLVALLVFAIIRIIKK